MIRPPVEPERPDYEDEENLPPTVHVYVLCLLVIVGLEVGITTRESLMSTFQAL